MKKFESRWVRRADAANLSCVGTEVFPDCWSGAAWPCTGASALGAAHGDVHHPSRIAMGHHQVKAGLFFSLECVSSDWTRFERVSDAVVAAWADSSYLPDADVVAQGVIGCTASGAVGALVLRCWCWLSGGRGRRPKRRHAAAQKTLFCHGRIYIFWTHEQREDSAVAPDLDAPAWRDSGSGTAATFVHRTQFCIVGLLASAARDTCGLEVV